MQEMIKILDSIANEENGIKLGAPWKRTDSSLGAIIPILSEASVSRDYVMLQEAEKAGKAHVKDTGDISKTNIKNSGDKPVFVRSSSIFKGETQERAATISAVIEPEASEDIEVKCVHASRPISGGAKMTFSGQVAPRRVSMHLSRGSQSQVWASVSRYSSSVSSSYPGMTLTNTDDLTQTLNTEKELGAFDKALGKVECLANQIGIIVFDEDGIEGLEIFDNPESWKAFHESVINGYKDILTKDSKTKLYKLDTGGIKAELLSFIKKCKKCTARLNAETMHSLTYSVKTENISGEYTLINGKIMHLLFLVANDKDEEKQMSFPNQFGLSPVPSQIQPYGDFGHTVRTGDVLRPIGTHPNSIGGYFPKREVPRRARWDNQEWNDNHLYYGEPRRRLPHISYQSSSFTATTSKMGNRTIIGVPKDVSGNFKSGSRVQVSYLGKKKVL